MTTIDISNDDGDTVEVEVDLDGTWYAKGELPEGITESDVDDQIADYKRDVEMHKGR
ncbi:MAG: hypothetical protein U5L04_01565 [Trueperaceae bacterium]|nr:hypothetical protein [Trueperaceae bacterium]